MAETSDSFAVQNPQVSNDPSSSASPRSNMNFWYSMYTGNAKTSEWMENRYLAGPSMLDHIWDHAFEKSTNIKKKIEKRGHIGSSSVMNSTTSDFSEALSAVSAALSLSPSSCSCSDSSGGRHHHWEKEQPELIKQNVENIQGEKMKNSTENCSSFSNQQLSSESNEDDTRATMIFGVCEETEKSNFHLPELGMAFSSEEEVYKFYKNYANVVGFRIRKGKVQRLSNGTIRKRYFFCSKQGFRLKKLLNKMTKYKKKETRTGCDAQIQCTVDNGKWVISQFVEQHNHHLEYSRQKTRSSTKPSDVRSMIQISNNTVIANHDQAIKDVECCRMESSASAHGELVNSLQPEDVQSLLNHLRYLQVEDLSFFYSVQLNSNCIMSNFFWRDGRSKIDYDYFGDVLILDTSFRMTKYDMICAQFVGANHHQHYVLFGCACLLDESKSSLLWLFETFLESMGRRQPKTVITDDSQVMADAVKLGFPEAQHLIGMWYIRQSARKNLPTFYKLPSFRKVFFECISNCQSEKEFELRWVSLVKQFNLHGNPWLGNLYMSKERWARIFRKKTFCAGLQYSMNLKSIFKRFTEETISLLNVVQQYQQSVERQRMAELCEDFHCNEIEPEIILSSSSMEKQAAAIYTRIMFKTFREELIKSLSLRVEEIYSNGMVNAFKLTEEDLKENIVEFSFLESSVACSCKKYESVGILCAHSLKVLNLKNISLIPPGYILKRWTKYAKDGLVPEDCAPESFDNKQQFMDFLMQKIMNVATKSLAVHESRKIVEYHVDAMLRRLENFLRAKSRDHLKMKDAEVHSGDKYDVYNQLHTKIRNVVPESNSSDGQRKWLDFMPPSSSSQQGFEFRCEDCIMGNKSELEGQTEAQNSNANASLNTEGSLIHIELQSSKEKSATPEMFKSHNPLNSSYVSSVKKLKVHPYSSQSWFEMKKARAMWQKDYDFLKRDNEILIQSNQRLRKELEDLRALIEQKELQE